MYTKLTALTNDRMKLIAKEATVCNDDKMAELIASTWEKEGFMWSG